MFAKRQSRMEKYVVDSETVEANKATRAPSPVASLPNEWKYTSSVRAPPSRSYNPILSPWNPPSKQPPSTSPTIKAKKKDQGKPKPAPKPLNVIDVMKHQPYQLDSSLFTFGPAVEAAKAAQAKLECSPPNPPVENQPIRYDQMAPVQQTGPYNTLYPQQGYGMPMQPMMHDGHYQQNPANIYPPSNPYQQPPAGPYQQPYNQPYQQPGPPAYHPQAPQSPNQPYQHPPQPPQAPYQPANSPPYMAAPSVPYQQQPPSSFVVSSFTVAARPESALGGPAAAPKPKFMAKKSSAQAFGRSYSLSPLARVPSMGQQSVSAASQKPQARASTAPPTSQTSWLEKGRRPIMPWEAASRHPLGLVDEAFCLQNLHQSLATNIRLAAQRKKLPEPPEKWKACSSYQAPQRTGSQTWSQSRTQSRGPLPWFGSLTRSSAPVPAEPAGYRSLPRQWQPQRAVTQEPLGSSGSSFMFNRATEKKTYKSVYTGNIWSWKR
ncbi:hypothetical protein CesoFtcFv8_026958 [Champsocephalus esox]|uniref:Synaptopodin 2 n=1 Tax=Champsocephalus esox TaxID=159716 RepID=A0AAN8GCJ7_9TELE|nr:hypothetical protein CesoFtcFv8_026958 [Champsocephalus esox]